LAILWSTALVVTLSGCLASTVRTAVPEAPVQVSIQQRWWNWAAGEAAATNPVNDRTGADCHRNQPDDAWFFAGTFSGTAHRTCAVPSGRPIVAPMINLIAPEPRDCSDFLDGATGSARLDGKPVVAQRMDGEPIVVSGVSGNPVTQTTTEYHATACGLWLSIAPPSVGEHTLSIDGESSSFGVQVDYTFEVIAP